MTLRYAASLTAAIFIATSGWFATATRAEAQTFENPTIGEKGYHVGTYGDGAYWVTEGGTNSMFVVSDEGVIVVDAPPSFAQKLPAAIAEVTDKPVTHFIYSHYHKDHTGGAGVFGGDVTYIGHSLTAKELQRVGDPNRPVPSVTFDDKYSLKVGNQEIELAYGGLNHTPGNTLIYLPSQQVLMLVDIIYPAVVPFARLGIAAHVPGYYDVIETALEYDFKFFQGGHLARPGTREEFELSRQYVLDLRNSAYAALAITTPPVQFFLPNNPIKDPYHAFAAFFDAASAACTEIVNQKWAGRLKGIGSFTQSHCWTAILEANVD
jgi:glyoxylase-like metal-dependent hydrolase (beta-lactamase superfamily II)